MTESLKNNKTLAIMKAAQEGSYAVVCMNCYDVTAVKGTIRAAERNRSPAMIQIFPVTMHYLGKAGLRYILDLAAAATVPVAVHLDHATTDFDLDTALTFGEEGVKFDSIMVDASHAETDEENIAISKKHIDRATKIGIACEVEMGRLEGGEAGLRVIADGQLTKPDKAEVFMRETGAILLAPCIGNLHGRYLQQPKFRFDILRDLQKICKPAGQYLVMHGTDDIFDPIFRECIDSGARKINLNSWARNPTMEFIAKSIQEDKLGLPEIYEQATEIYSRAVDRFMVLFESAGKA